MTARLQSRAGRYTPWRERPDLCDEAERRFGLSGAVYRRFQEGEFVAGDRNGRHLLYCARTWTLIEPSPEPIGERAEQGRLL
ncbi:MAG: hypothetical protein EHM35_00160 [Planctomycetaceae bacterium]|nr:MAG: hypothetical protein EHM35_00160 [Planctomycetaceae bacterium]